MQDGDGGPTPLEEYEPPTVRSLGRVEEITAEPDGAFSIRS